MGMRINTGSGIDPKFVDKLVELERNPIKQIEERKKSVVDEKKLFSDLKTLITGLGTTLNALRNKTDFFKLKLTSSNAEIIDGTVDNTAPVGSYELELLKIARTNKLLTQSFPDKNETSVGFGYMSIEREDGSYYDVDIDPDFSTLQDVANQINAANAGLKAMIINTKESLNEDGEENYRLLVVSEKSGKASKIYIDPDSTYVEYEEQVQGQNLEMIFEDVKIYNDSNKITELVPGMVLDAKKAAPGTKVTLKVDYDVDKTLEEIKKFIDSYNKVNEFLEKQFKIDENTNRAGVLAKDNSLKTLRRTLQTAMQFSIAGHKYENLAQVGITTDAKTGNLKFDETKFKQTLSEDYDGVSKLFIQSDKSAGLAIRMSDAVRGLQNQQYGVLASKDREYKRLLDSFDKDIVTKERYAAQRGEAIKRRFTAVEQLISNLNSQGQAMQARLGGGGG